MESFTFAKRGLGYERLAEREKARLLPTEHPNVFGLRQGSGPTGARLVALSRLTKGAIGGCFILNTRIAFGNGCEHPNYVGGPIARFFRISQEQIKRSRDRAPSTNFYPRINAGGVSPQSSYA